MHIASLQCLHGLTFVLLLHETHSGSGFPIFFSFLGACRFQVHALSLVYEAPLMSPSAPNSS